MKIKFDSTIFRLQKFGGISRYFFEISKEMSNLNLNDEIKIMAPFYKNKYIKRSNLVKGFYFNEYPKYTNYIFREMNDFFERIDENFFKYDIHHLTYYNNLNYKSKSKKIITVYDMIHEKFPDQFRMSDLTTEYKKKNVKDCDHILCISESTKNDLIDIFNVPEDKISVTYLGARLEEGLILDLKDDYFLYVGSRLGYKNFVNFIKAYAINKKMKNQIKIFVFGGGGFSNIEINLFRSLGICEDFIVHMGNNESLLDGLYKNALAFVYPSLYEGFGLPPLEAMIRGCPVVISNQSSIPEVVGNAGIYFDPYLVEDISQALSKIVFDQEIRYSMIERGFERVKAFTWKNCAIQTRTIYENLL